MEMLLWPPIAFLLYVPLVVLLAGFGRVLAGPSRVNAIKTSIYGSGEAPPTYEAAPGYRPFFVVAFFFAVLHLSILVLGLGSLPLPAIIYVVGLMFALLALILG